MTAILLIGRISSGPATQRAQQLSRRVILLAKKLGLAVLAALLLYQIVPSTAHAVAPSITAGNGRSCTINAAGGALCWGDNSSGALGNGAAIISSTPIVVTGLSSGVAAIATAAGAYHTCAVTTAGGALCWGNNGSGQLGNGTVANSSVPAPVSGLSSGVAAMAMGTYHTCALTTAGGVKCWGNNSYRQLGNGTTTSHYVPVDVTGLSSGVRAITSGFEHACALTTSGGVLCWGNNRYGQFGNGTTTNSSVPVPVTGLSSGVAAITAGNDHTCALTTAGGVLCWGYNSNGQLGNGTTTASSLPVAVTGLSSGVAAIAAGLYHTCALTTAGSVLCWGNNGDGRLGNGTTSNSSMPIPVTGLSSGVGAIAAGYAHTCALTNAGEVLCWGYNGAGQFGNGTKTSSSTPVSATGLSARMSAIATGTDHTCALTTGGGMLCWGGNLDFQLGNGQAVGISTPVLVTGRSSGNVAIATGAHHTCALTTAGGVLCWGEDGQGQLGNGGFSASSSIPVQSGLSSGVAAIATGDFFTCALTTAGGVQCWGDNAYGQLGNGTTTSSAVPVPVTGLSSGVAAIAAGADHACALTTAGGVQCWGYNDSGQLGVGTTSNSSVPNLVTGLSNGVTAIAAAGGSFTCALTTAGSVQCWGANYDGQLGNGTTTNSSVPVPVTGLSSGVAAIAAGRYHSCALTSVGGVLCWGYNFYGERGDGTTTNSSVPVPVAGLSSGITAVATGWYHTCALASAGDVLCWGYNSSGGLGDGTFANRRESVVVVRELGAGSLATNDWFLDLNPSIPKTIPSDKIPSYLVTASGNATTAVVDVKADVTFRSQDLGRAIYVFGYVPASLVKRAAFDKDASTCVLAQLTPSGQLQQVSASSLQSFAGNVTSAQRQTVNVLNNVLATQVAGATFCIGSGATGSPVDANNSKCVATVPGDQICLPPKGSTPTANVPGALSGLWWNPNESGWGISFTQRRNIVFAAWYTYDTAGNPKWYTASNCAMPAGTTGTSGTCNGVLYEANGPTFFGTAFNSSLVNVLTAGSLQVNFQNANNASMTYTVGAQTRTVAITRQIFRTGATAPAIDYTDLWWNPNESGWGIAVTHQFGVMFLTWFVYDNSGKPMWYAATSCTVSGAGCSGTLYRATGPAFGPTFDASQVRAIEAGTVTLSFSDANNGTLSYTVNSVTSSKTITRQLF